MSVVIKKDCIVDNINYINRMPDEILFNIFEHLDAESLHSVAFVSKQFFSLAEDRRLWKSLADRRGVWIEAGSDPRDEWNNLKRVSLLSSNSSFPMSIAEAVGPSRFLAIMQGQGSARCHRNRALLIQCVEQVTRQTFSLKLVASKDGSRALVYYSGINSILEPLGSKKVVRHEELPLKNDLAGYIRRLLQGSPCGIIREGKEDLTVLVAAQA